ncbi:MAG: NifB/NifX family molybdenum-iron cluster-binding protein [Candidatus Bathyarchaeota archaeon]|nr:NifB/NifX family molybdenum-iron cluster-binding protein [Candidatus Bathyarchaeota archaeon]
MRKLRIAVPTKTHAGLEDVVSEVFGKAKTFTIVDVEDGEVKNVQVIDNPAASYEHGAGPVTVKMLADQNIDLVVTAELGPGASSLLEQHNIKEASVKPNTKVADSIKEALSKLKPE